MSPNPVDETDPDPAIGNIREWLATLEWGSCVVDLRTLNGQDMLFLEGYPNHARGIDIGIITLYKRIGAAAPGSYGLLYERNEDTSGEFSVWVLRRGTLSKREDPFFAPFIPTVEDLD